MKLMDTKDNQKQPNREHIEGSNDSKPPNVDAGNMIKSPNPRANENLNNPSGDNSKIKQSPENSVGTEITDGEDG
jgi:hypothetical protein